MIGIVFVYLISVISSTPFFYYTHKEGDSLKILVGSLTSGINPIPFNYYMLNICKPSQISEEDDNLGDILTGEKKYNTIYTTHLKQDEFCKKACTVKFSEFLIKRLNYLNKKKYISNWFIDALPAVLLKYDPILDKTIIDHFSGIPLTYTTLSNEAKTETFIYNHFQFRILIHQIADNLYEIVGFNILPLSIEHKDKLECASSKSSIMNNFKTNHQQLTSNTDITFTYDIIYEESNLTLSSRWDHYRPKNKDIHLFGVLISNVLIIICTGLVVLIFCWIIRRDADLFNSRVINDDILDEYGWKQVSNDVFRPCRNRMLYATLIGTGVQLSFMLVLTLIIGILGFMKPEKRGYLLTLGILLFVFMGLPGGYISTKIYKVLQGTYWLKTALLTAVFFPGITFLLYSIINFLLAVEGSSAAVNFSEYFSLLVLWICCSSPLVIIGAFFGIKSKPIDIPCKINVLPTTIPPKPWFFQFKFTFWIAGILSFSAIFIELVYIMASIWKHQIYFMGTFLVIAVIILLIICSEITIVLIYINLCRGDYCWWWKSFLFGGSSSLFVLAYSVYYFVELKITRFSGIIIYFGLMGLISSIIFLIGGSTSALCTFYFVKVIYSMIKLD